MCTPIHGYIQKMHTEVKEVLSLRQPRIELGSQVTSLRLIIPTIWETYILTTILLALAVFSL